MDSIDIIDVISIYLSLENTIEEVYSTDLENEVNTDLVS